MMLLSAGIAITQAVLVIMVHLRRRDRSRLERWRKSRRQASCMISALETDRFCCLNKGADLGEHIFLLEGAQKGDEQ
jgi:hypothetical protein